MLLMSEPIDRDAHTGLYNHRFFRDALARELARARRYGHPLTLIVFDIDDFKQINDQHGHVAGNAILAALAGRLRGLVRASDIACRIGGDEFAVILPESRLEDANQFWARGQDELAAKPYEYAGAISLSCGIGEFDPDEDATTLVSRVDLALHQAKIAGKAQIAIADPPPPHALEPTRRHGPRRRWERYASKQWEYCIEEGEPDADRLNELGAEGWELTATLAGKLIFKRRRRPDEPPEPPTPEGGTGVREPRRATPSSGEASTRKPPPDDA
jgi:diguanylate cyclase (GGDEF)-like protein